MIIGDEKLKKVSDDIFQEAEPPEDRSRPLEWRRSFNPIILPLKNLSINTTCNIHDTDFEWGEKKSPNPLKLVKPEISQLTSISGYVDEDELKDRIYCTVKDDENDTLCTTERPQGDIRVNLKPGDPSEESERLPQGIYHGRAFRMNYDPGEDDFYFELTMPEHEFESLISSVKSDSNPKLEVCVHLLSFTFEVDDFLSEPHQSRDIVIDDSAHCYISWINSSYKIGRHTYPKPEEDVYDEYDYNDELPPEQQRHLDLVQTLLTYLKPLNSIVTAIWVLIIVVILNAFLS